MINDESICWYFNNMRTKGFLPLYCEYGGYLDDRNHIRIYYNHKSGKRYSYRFLKELIVQEIRDSKIKSILDN